MKASDLFNKLLRNLAQLRSKRDGADVRFLLRLVQAEQDPAESAAVSEAGFSTFTDFIEAKGFCKPGRYEAFKKGLAKIGEHKARRLGAAATIIAAGLSDGCTSQYVDALDAWVQLKHMMPSRETAKRILMQTDPRAEVPEVLKQASCSAALATLRSEVERTRQVLRNEGFNADGDLATCVAKALAATAAA